MKVMFYSVFYNLAAQSTKLDKSKINGYQDGNSGLLTNAINALLYIATIISIIMIIYGGISYATSEGDPKKVASAKATILYAVIGLIVALFAVAIVQFVSTRIK